MYIKQEAISAMSSLLNSLQMKNYIFSPLTLRINSMN